jgi:hypothetical protein
LDYVVEPWFMGGGKDSEPGKDFSTWQADVERQHGTKFVTALKDLPPPTQSTPAH